MQILFKRVAVPNILQVYINQGTFSKLFVILKSKCEYLLGLVILVFVMEAGYIVPGEVAICLIW